MRETGFFTGLCCWSGVRRADGADQTVQQAQSALASASEVTGAAADSEPLLQSPSRGPAGLSVHDSASLSKHRKTSDRWAEVPLKGILKKPGEKRSGQELSDQEPWQTASVGSTGHGNKAVSFDPMMTVYRIEPRNASMTVNHIHTHARTYRHILRSKAKEEQSSEAKVNASKNSAISEQGEKLRTLFRYKASVGTAPGRPCLASKRSLPESGSTKASGGSAQTDQ